MYGVTDWWDAAGERYTDGVWKPLVVAQPAGSPQYAFKVVGETWWMADAYHDSDHTRGVAHHYQYTPGGLDYYWKDMGYTGCWF